MIDPQPYGSGPIRDMGVRNGLISGNTFHWDTIPALHGSRINRRRRLTRRHAHPVAATRTPAQGADRNHASRDPREKRHPWKARVARRAHANPPSRHLRKHRPSAEKQIPRQSLHDCPPPFAKGANNDCFAVAIHAYAVMSNHLHRMRQMDSTHVDTCSDAEVAERWVRLFSIGFRSHPQLHADHEKKRATFTARLVGQPCARTFAELRFGPIRSHRCLAP